MDKMASDIDEIKKMLTSINTTLAEAKGGWRVLIGVAGAGGVLGATLTHFANWWTK
jgi:hypothetical protein